MSEKEETEEDSQTTSVKAYFQNIFHEVLAQGSTADFEAFLTKIEQESDPLLKELYIYHLNPALESTLGATPLLRALPGLFPKSDTSKKILLSREVIAEFWKAVAEKDPAVLSQIILEENLFKLFFTSTEREILLDTYFHYVGLGSDALQVLQVFLLASST